MSTQTTFGDQDTTAHTLSFTLHNAGRDELELETGEVFRNPAYASGRRGKQNVIIFAHLTVSPASEGRNPLLTNKMDYFEGNDLDGYVSPPFIHVSVSIPASDYSLLLNNVRGEMMPSAVMVGLPHDERSPIQYDRPSKKVWRNAMQQNRRIDIERIEFHYQLIGNVYDDDEDTKPPTFKASIDAASVAIVTKLADLEKTFVKGSSLIVTAVIIVCAVLYFARH